VLRYWAGHTYQEIAKIMGCPLPTAQSRVRQMLASPASADVEQGAIR